MLLEDTSRFLYFILIIFSFIFLLTTLSLTLWRIGFRGHQRRADRTVLFIIIFVFSWCSRATEKAKKNFTRNVQKTEKLNSAKNKQKGRPNVYFFFSVEDLKILLSAVTRGYNEMRPKKKARLEGERMIDCMLIWHF